jgi:hypothetical protein
MASVMLVVGIVLLLVAGAQAAEIPVRAHDDFGALIVRKGVMSNPPDYASVYRRMSADRRMLRNAYVGGEGPILFAAGSFGLVSAARLRRLAADEPPGRPTGDRPI